MNEALARVAADLRLQHGWKFDRIGRALSVSTSHARCLAVAGGWERPKWPLMVTRITKDGRAFVVKRIP